MKSTVRTTLKYTLFAAAFAAPLCFAGGAKAEPRTHDGFYMQLSTGLGYLSSSVEGGSFHGIASPFEALFGGTVGPVAIGGGIFSDYALSVSASSDAGPSFTYNDLSMYMVGAEAFGDIYIDPHGGFHIRPFIGYAALQFSYQGYTGNSPGGPIFGAGIGYDFWVGDEWSIGVLGRFGYAPLKLEGSSFNTMDPAIMASFTFN